jgi:pimeloyl-ACP methyl ester carboxylesterase
VKVYFIPGLGADSSVFKYIHLPPHCQPVYLDWVVPHKNESLSDYALRMAEKIDRSEAFSLVGLSMGGMIGVEIARHFKPLRTILISSIPSSLHLPAYYRYLGALWLHKFIPVSLFQKGAILKRLFTAEKAEDKRMLKAMIRKTDVNFIRWAMEAILAWKNEDGIQELVHIHGTHDEILPKRFTRPTHVINRGGHLMIMNRAEEINRILAEVLGSEAGDQK